MEDILVDIFKYTRCPASFMRVNKSWLNTAKNPVSRCHWLINHYGKAHSLFFAVYFGPSFISIDLVNCALRNGVILSRYFLQVLMKCYVRYDGSNHSNFEKSWGSDLPLDVYEKLLAEGNRRWNGGFCLNGNDLELFHYLNRGNAENVLNDIRETLRMVSKAIIAHPELVDMWKEIGYESICYDYSDLVFQILYTEHPMLETILA
ncbi:7892_t:CDS:2 [Entrophospora sp. SA101]|nr:12877_t:CDS:2 [Entrophospora sp. SA101]CAJ0892816.1 176_t:CDS:2 [Entrophospora sp. SA101]CAJ0906999.1 8719_t:CDS:2 [Entrophospora sp. SA101]CAJ0911546.1 7892_t:CDS:2 [Entrophospora sp. SA101]